MKLTDLIGNKAYVYGTGGFALRIKNLLHEQNIDVHAFLEINKEISTYDLLPVCKLDDFQNLDKTIPVIMGLGNTHADIKIVTRLLESCSFQIINPIQFAISAFESGQSFENYWLTGDLSVYDEKRQEIRLARSLLEDEKSIDIFDHIIEYRKSGKIEHLPEKLDVSSQYIAPDLPWGDTFKNGLDVLDGGAFDGDTYEYFKKAKLKINSWAFVEPDPYNFSILQSKFANLGNNFEFFNFALSSRIGYLNFEVRSGSDNGSKITEDGLQKISVVTLDSITFQHQPNFIKLDIEGEELNALQGGSDLLKLSKAVLAVSIYHKPVHHWEIVNYLSSLLPKSRFFLRVHGHQTFDSILYCFPPKL